jgi:hypothetical protein
MGPPPTRRSPVPNSRRVLRHPASRGADCAVDGCNRRLHRNPAALNQLEEILTGDDIRYRPGEAEESIRVSAPDPVLAGQPLTVAVDLDNNARPRAIAEAGKRRAVLK